MIAYFIHEYIFPLHLRYYPNKIFVLGVVWPNDPFSMGCPACANRESSLFVSDIVSSTETTSDDFVLLSPSKGKHVRSPRFSGPDGAILVYLENDVLFHKIKNSNICIDLCIEER